MRFLWLWLLPLSGIRPLVPARTPAHPVTVLILTDMEGVMGAADPDLFYSAPEHDTYGRRLLTAEVQAAIQGARAAGAQCILLSDSHFRGDNLDWTRIPPDVIRLTPHALEGSHPRAEVSGIFMHGHPAAA